MEFAKKHKKKLIISAIVLILILAIVIYFLHDFSHKFIFKESKLFFDDKQVLVGFEDLEPSSDNINYSFSVFIRANNLDGNTSWIKEPNSKRYIIDNGGSPNIVYYRNTGDIVVEIAYKDRDGVKQYYEFVLEHFPVQKWTQLCVSVNGRFIQLFKNGDLYSAKKLETAPYKSQRMLSIGKRNQNFNGYIGLIDYYNRPLEIEEVKKLYYRRKKSLPSRLLTYEQVLHLEKDENIEGKVDKIPKV